MKLTMPYTTQPAADTGVARAVTPRPYGIGTGIGTGLGTAIGICARNVLAAAWSAISRKPMSEPTFHDRWPLYSTT